MVMIDGLVGSISKNLVRFVKEISKDNSKVRAKASNPFRDKW